MRALDCMYHLIKSTRLTKITAAFFRITLCRLRQSHDLWINDICKLQMFILLNNVHLSSLPFNIFIIPIIRICSILSLYLITFCIKYMIQTLKIHMSLLSGLRLFLHVFPGSQKINFFISYESKLTLRVFQCLISLSKCKISM